MPTFDTAQRDSRGIEIPGSNVGRHTVQSVISALEWERNRKAHLYRDVQEAQRNLRSDSRIKRIEAAAKHNEPARNRLAHAKRSVGTSAGRCLLVKE